MFEKELFDHVFVHLLVVVLFKMIDLKELKFISLSYLSFNRGSPLKETIRD